MGRAWKLRTIFAAQSGTDAGCVPGKGVYQRISDEPGEDAQSDALQWLLLYMEHPFAFRRHPEIWEGSDPITPEDILALQTAAVPWALNCRRICSAWGHCRRILTRKEHMHLSESDMFWSLCTTSEESIALLDDLFGEYLPQFDSEWVNICLMSLMTWAKERVHPAARSPGNCMCSS